MSRESASGAWWEPTWRRLVGSTLVLFVVILAFLVGRVRAGADPGLVREATQAPQVQTAPPAASGSGVDPQSQGVEPNDPFADPGPTGGGTTDNFGNAVPDDQGSGSTNGFDGSGAQSLDPPSTHVS